MGVEETYNEMYKLPEEKHEEIYKELFKITFEDKTSVVNPRAIVIGGQPGCGKSGLIKMSKNEFSDNNVVVINGDEYRRYYPEPERQLIMTNGHYVAMTDPDVRLWTSKLFEYAMNNKYNVIFEGTMRTNQICDTIKRMGGIGYRISVRALSVNYMESLMSIWERYESQRLELDEGRFTTKSAHDKAY